MLEIAAEIAFYIFFACLGGVILFHVLTGVRLAWKEEESDGSDPLLRTLAIVILLAVIGFISILAISSGEVRGLLAILNIIGQIF
jgi:hypothetical protein